MDTIEKAIVIATVDQLNEIGVDEPIMNKEVEVYDMDKYSGMYSPCSRVVFYKKYDEIPDTKFKCEFIIPTRWLLFNKN